MQLKYRSVNRSTWISNQLQRKLLNWLRCSASPTAKRKARPFSSQIEVLEDRTVLSAAFPAFIDPNPSSGNGFGRTIVPLSTGNVVITAPGDDAGGTDAGAVYLFNGSTGGLISTLIGSHDYDYVGDEIRALPNGHFLIASPEWDNGSIVDAGAVTFGNGMTGVSGIISAANSLVGSSDYDSVGGFSGDVVVLPNSNYLVASSSWDNGTLEDAGAVTFGNGTTGVMGTISASNSLIGTSAYDRVGDYGVAVLTNGNYVVGIPDWDNGLIQDAGAVTWGNGMTGITGAVSSTNSLVGSTEYDNVGSGYVHVLDNGNYVVSSYNWDYGSIIDAGAVTFGNGTTGISGEVSAANSLVGSSDYDYLGDYVTPLNTGNYVVSSGSWDRGSIVDAGAATFGNGTTGITGEVSLSNSLVGSRDYQYFGYVTVLDNGNYVAADPYWSNGSIVEAGAVTFGNGKTGVVGEITAANSLIGSSAYDRVGYDVYALTNGNFVVCSPDWDNGSIEDVGAVTFVNGTTGMTGVVSAANSLIGTSEDDSIGYAGVTALTNGNYVVSSYNWDNGSISDAGAVTWGNGTTGTSGIVSAANSLVGSTAGDRIGGYFSDGVTALPNGNYVVNTPDWDNGSITDAGAVTFGNGATGISGAVSASNSLVGSSNFDNVGDLFSGITILANDNYLVLSRGWDDGSNSDVGAVTLGNRMTGVSGALTATNSLIGLPDWESLGTQGIITLSSGNYLLLTRIKYGSSGNDEWAVSFGNGETGVSGYPTANNTISAITPGYEYPDIVTDDFNGTFYLSFKDGRVLVGSQENGFPGVSLDPVNPIIISKNAPEQVVNLSGIATSGYLPVPLRVTATSDNTSLIPDPTVTYSSPDGTGSLTFTPAADQTGSATITVTVEDGGLDGDLETTGDNGILQRTFIVNVADTPVSFDMRVVQDPTAAGANDEVDTLPDSVDWIEEWSSFWLEIWMDTSDVDSQGILSAAFDLNYQTEYFTATDIQYGAAFNLNQGGTINDAGGVITNLAAETDVTGLGISKHLLLARIQFESLEGDGVDIDYDQQMIGPHALDFSFSGTQVSVVSHDPASPFVNAFQGTNVWANPYDLNDDGVISYRDLILFASVYNAIPSQSSSDYAWVSDFDQDDRVSYRDLILFASNYGKKQILQSEINYPGNYPAAWDNQLVVAPSPLPLSAGESLTQTAAETTLDSAVDALAPQLTEDEKKRLDGVQIQVVDLEEGVLGRVVGNTIYVDQNAAGYGWFVDATPLDHSEFQPDSALTLIALPESEAFGYIDLWTVIQHELGHILGYHHSDNGLMEDSLLPGVRKEADWEGSLDLYFTSAAEESDLVPF